MIGELKMKYCGGKKDCVYYNACGNTENCSRCSSYKKEKKNKK